MKNSKFSNVPAVLCFVGMMFLVVNLIFNEICINKLVQIYQHSNLNSDQLFQYSTYAWISVTLILVNSIFLFIQFKKLTNFENSLQNQLPSTSNSLPSKNKFLSNMSHEIRSPLTCIIGFTDIIDRLETDPEKKKYLQAIKTSSDHLLNTVNDILDFSKLDAGKLQLDVQPFNISTAIHEIAFAFSAIAAEKGIIIKEEIGLSEDLIVIGDKFRLKQILYNLTSNAIKFTQKGIVVITAEAILSSKNQADIKIQVADTGIGIPRLHLKTIFEEFGQVKSSNQATSEKRAISGTGLGLPICKMLIELQGGSIHVASKVNEGSVFSFILSYPIQSESFLDKAESSLYHSSKSKQLYAGKKALIIEDNEMNAMLLSFLLNKQQLQFDVVRNGKLGWELFNENKYDIVLTDINVPEMTGDQLATAIRNTPNSKSKMPVIALTASVMKEDLDDYRKSGISDILVKPFKESDLNKILQKHIYRESEIVI